MKKFIIALICITTVIVILSGCSTIYSKKHYSVKQTIVVEDTPINIYVPVGEINFPDGTGDVIYSYKIEDDNRVVYTTLFEDVQLPRNIVMNTETCGTQIVYHCTYKLQKHVCVGNYTIKMYDEFDIDEYKKDIEENSKNYVFE